MGVAGAVPAAGVEVVEQVGNSGNSPHQPRDNNCLGDMERRILEGLLQGTPPVCFSGDLRKHIIALIE